MSTRPRILVNKNTPLAVEVFSRIGSVTALGTSGITKEAVKDVDILIVRAETKVNRALLEGSAVRFVGTVTIGTDHVDLDYLAERGIRFASAPGCNSTSVAEYITAALLTWAQRTGVLLEGKTLGVVGVGNVGGKVVKVGRALGMEVLCNDPPLARSSGDAVYRPLDELMDADVLTLHVPLTTSGPDATYHLFDSARIRRMKPGSVLINTSRGGVVETGALRAALGSNHLSASIIDVWEGEPVIDIELLKSVMIGTPHIAGYSLEGKLKAVQMIAGDVCRYLGIPDVWDPALVTRYGEPSPVTLPDPFPDHQSLLASLVRQGYDIELDDRLLRKTLALPDAERSAYFSRLRAEYRIRHEFSRREVRLPSVDSRIGNVLRDLGFNVK